MDRQLPPILPYTAPGAGRPEDKRRRSVRRRLARLRSIANNPVALERLRTQARDLRLCAAIAAASEALDVCSSARTCRSDGTLLH